MAHVGATFAAKTWLSRPSSASKAKGQTTWTSWLGEQEWWGTSSKAVASSQEESEGFWWCLGQNTDSVTELPIQAQQAALKPQEAAASSSVAEASRAPAADVPEEEEEVRLPEEPLEEPAEARPPVKGFSFQHDFSQENPGELRRFYELNGRRLGEGAFGSVQRATCKSSGMQRAVKSVSLKAVRHLGNFEREISIAKSLDHPNIVRLYETFRDSACIHLVIELCAGGELFERVSGTEGLGEPQASAYVRQILSAICYLHSRQLAHRDVKPENFLLQNNKPNATLKMIDFGLARRFEPGQPMKTRVGTAYYVAPQVLLGSYSQKCDIWSAGVIAYILLCGYPPFYGDTDDVIFKQIRKSAYQFFSPEWDDISRGAKDIIVLMLTDKEAIRPSAEALLTNAWLRPTTAPKTSAIGGGFVAALRSFQGCTPLQKVARTAVAQQLPDEETGALREMFQSLDANGDGVLSPEEVRDGLQRHGLQVPRALEDLLQVVDSDGSGHLDYSEFVAATMDEKLCSKKNICKAAFRTFDLDGDGRISLDELSAALAGAKRPQTPNTRGKMGRLLGEGDVNGDGFIDFEEFCAMVASPAKQLEELPLARRSRTPKSTVLLGREGHTSLRLGSGVAPPGSQPQTPAHAGERQGSWL